ncbi:MAG: efflux RND transporter permease subunit [Bacteroidota bacterium]
MKIVETSIRRPIYVIVFFTVITILGFLGYKSLNAELMPSFTPPLINVSIVYPGAAPSEVENSLTRKVEDALSSMEGVDKIQSYSYEGLSMMIVTFVYGTDIDKAITDAQNLIDSKKMELPRDILSPRISKITVNDKSIITLSATSDLEATAFYDLMDKRIVPALSSIRGMARVDQLGGQRREIQVNLDPEKMQAFGMSPAQIQGVLRASNLDFPTGSVRNSETSTILRLSGKFTGIDEIRNLVVFTTPTGFQVRMKDIAEIADAVKDPVVLARVNGEEAVLLYLFKQSDANAIEVSDAVHENIQNLMQEYSSNSLQLSFVQDSTEFTRESISSVIRDLILIVILVFLVMLLFLHNFRNALVVMIVVPVSLIATFIGMNLLDFSLNLMSLLGLSLVIGVLVDDAIVVLENVYRHIEMNKNRVRATNDALKEIGFTIISVTIVLIIVFLPIALTNSLVSDILLQFSGVIVISTAISLVAALTLVPLLTSRFGNIQILEGKNLFQKFLLGFERMITNFSNWIARLLSWSLGHKRWVGLTIIALTVAVFSLFPLGFIGFEFLPDVDRGEFIAQMDLPKDYALEESVTMVRKAENWLLENKNVEKVITNMTATSATLNVKLVPAGQRDVSTRLFITQIKKPLTDYLIDARVKLFNVSLTGETSKAAVEYIISGPNYDSVMYFADRALDIMRSIPGTLQQELSIDNGTPEIVVTVDRDKMSALGLTLDNVGFTMQMIFQGNNSLKYTEGDYEYDINIRSDKGFRRQVEDVRNMTFINTRGESVRLSQFADIRLGTGPNMLERYNRNSAVTIRTQVLGVSTGVVSREFKNKVDAAALPAGITLSVTGDMQSMGDSMKTMTAALLLSLILVYLALVVLYNNWLDPLAVMFSIPLSILGAILALGLTNSPLSIYGMLGLVMLMGLVAKNAILLVDFANEARREGKDIDEALIQAVRIRTRPILMTALSTIIGMLPVALSRGAGAELRNGLAWVIIGGMALSTFLTLIVVPVVYKILNRRKSKRVKVDIEALLRGEESPAV